MPLLALVAAEPQVQLDSRGLPAFTARGPAPSGGIRHRADQHEEYGARFLSSKGGTTSSRDVTAFNKLYTISRGSDCIHTPFLEGLTVFKGIWYQNKRQS